MKTTLIAAAALSLALAANAPRASANVFTETYYGIIDSTVPATFTALPGAVFPPSVMDNAGLFGGGDLQGDLIVATFSYDTSLGVMNSGYDYTTSHDYSSVDGGFAYDGVTPSPITYADFQITTADLKTYNYGYVPDARGSVATEPGYMVDDAANSLAGDESYVGLFTPLAPNDVSTPFVSSTFPDGTSGSYFAPIATNTGVLDNITFDTIAVTVTPAPEPSTWALMMAGVGGVGLMLRRKRRSPADAFAA